MKEQEEIRYRFITREECLTRYGDVRPPTWNDDGEMDSFLGKEVPFSLAFHIIKYGTSSGFNDRYKQPEYIYWSFNYNDIIKVTKADNFF
jgi:hypothetical protein